MSGIIYEYEEVERFIAGTVGQPGERSFYIQARKGKKLTTVLLEKSQIAALAERTKIMLREIKRSDPSIRILQLDSDDLPLEQPIFEEFRVGVIAMAWDAQTEKIVYELRQAQSADQDDEEILFSEEDLSGDLLRVHVSPTYAQSFAKRAEMVVNSGRVECPFCGIPIDLAGHLCPRANGYRR